MTKYYRDVDGNYIGGFDGVEPPEGSIEVDEPPQNAVAKWVGNKWVEPADNIRKKRQRDFIADLSPEGSFDETVIDILDALINNAYGDSTTLDALKIKIDVVNARHRT